MMTLIKETGASVALAAMLWVAPAAAADLGGYAPRGPIADAPVAAPFSWTGFYAGANAGYAWNEAHFGITPTGGWTDSPTASANLVSFTTGTLRPDGFTGGIQIGWNRQVNNLVWGFEADINVLDADASRSGGEIPGTDGVIAGFSQNAEMSWMATLRLRLGLAMDRTLIYATGGVALADWDLRMTLAPGELQLVPSGSSSSALFSSSQVETGWVVGGGIEYAFASRWSLKAEYLYADFGEVRGTSAFPDTSLTHSHRVDLTTQIVRAGINYKF